MNSLSCYVIGQYLQPKFHFCPIKIAYLPHLDVYQMVIRYGISKVVTHASGFCCFWGFLVNWLHCMFHQNEELEVKFPTGRAMAWKIKGITSCETPWVWKRVFYQERKKRKKLLNLKFCPDFRVFRLEHISGNRKLTNMKKLLLPTSNNDLPRGVMYTLFHLINVYLRYWV